MWMKHPKRGNTERTRTIDGPLLHLASFVSVFSFLDLLKFVFDGPLLHCTICLSCYPHSKAAILIIINTAATVWNKLFNTLS